MPEMRHLRGFSDHSFACAALPLGMLMALSFATPSMAQTSAAVIPTPPPAPTLAIATPTDRQPGKIGGVVLPETGTYEPQCGGRPAELMLNAAEIAAAKDRSAFAVQANAFNAYLAAYSSWSFCVGENMRRDVELIQAAVTTYDAIVLTPTDQRLAELATALQKKSVELTGPNLGAAP